MVSPLEGFFPGLRGAKYQITSPEDGAYNCVAWAAGVVERWWWPGTSETEFWPPGVARVATLEAFRDAFRSQGYAECTSEESEPGVEKIALFADAHGAPMHAARQLPNGRWTSKLGELEDIEHSLHDLTGEEYGSVVQVMKRPVPAHKPAPTGEAPPSASPEPPRA